MLPLQQAREVRNSVLEYIKATFQFKEGNVHDAFYRFIEDPKDGLFKGPYVSLKTPFLSATDEEAQNIPLEIKPSFAPYKHQLKAFRQLSFMGGHRPEPTLLTTGTGSGKTECFLYPVLDYCYHLNKYEHRQGVKVIILYPMNALATDQAKRLAKTIYNDERLRGKVTAGLFIGTGDSANLPSAMTADNIIEDRNAIIQTVPDILLTNFKMLDYALMQQRYMPLWKKGNIEGDEKMLRFIVLDELHTYDGAQGTDVANLIRRLKLKLNLPDGHLCPIGTSATIGNGPDSKSRLCDYAGAVFGEPFDAQNVIEEERIPAKDYVEPEEYALPGGEKLLSECDFKDDDTVETYRLRLARTWFGANVTSPEDVGIALRQSGFVLSILKALEGGILSITELTNTLEDDKEFRLLRQQHGEEATRLALESIFALIAYAKRKMSGDVTMPVMYLQVQLWQRELSGILRYVQNDPEFVWRDSLSFKKGCVALPMYFCRSCGASGWMSFLPQGATNFSTDVTEINRRVMDRDKNVRLLNLGIGHEPMPEYKTPHNGNDNQQVFVRRDNLAITESPAQNTLSLQMACRTSDGNKTNGVMRFQDTCPECASSSSICVVGARTTNLSSVAVSQVLATDFDETCARDRKILVFTNSVQDAAHQAGYYEARTYRFLFRQAMQSYINTLSSPVTLADLQKGFKEYWHAALTTEQYLYRFIPSDIARRVKLDYNFRDGKGDWTDEFKAEFDLRIDWEILSEFSLNAQLGRTLEKTGSSAVFFDANKIKKVFACLKPWLEENHLNDVAANQDAFCRFVYGVLQHMRLRGAVDHPFLQKFRNVELKTWNLNWNKDSRHYLNKYFGNIPKPRPVSLSLNVRSAEAEFLDLAGARNDSKSTWWTEYFRKTLNATWSNLELYNDFMRTLFASLVDNGILDRAEAGNGNYVIRPEAILVSKNVRHFQCNTCQSTLCVAAEDVLAFSGIHCLNYHCTGIYAKEKTLDFNYYRLVYNRKASPRVYAHEHTGLLDRRLRESIEVSFKNHSKVDDVNVLSATSTLEMGIDIGDLNVMGNTGVPPEPSNFLQRVGRAGRKEGSALVLNYAHAREQHDMYYFEYPKEMMQGEINTPGCYLGAHDILARHFLAFCLDTWTSCDHANKMPAVVMNLKLMQNDAVSSKDFIANRIVAYIQDHKRTLKSSFMSMYDSSVVPVLEQLFESLDNGDFAQKLITPFIRLKNRLSHYRDELKHLKEIKAHTSEREKEVVESLSRSIRAVNRARGLLLKENLLEFMTNEGLLPNYAFPETGIRLDANIYAGIVKGDEEKSKARKINPIKLVRPASQGIREIAPGSSFYTQKYKLKVDGISTCDWNETLGEARFCPTCDEMLLSGEDGFNDAVCPKCGDPAWQANRHAVVRFTNSVSTNESSSATLDDAEDDREKFPFVCKKHFRFIHENGKGISYVMKGLGFGIEFCKKFILTEVNYGAEKQSGTKINVNGEQVSGYGFIVCRHCGKATPVLGRIADAKELHTRFCPKASVNFDQSNQTQTDDVFKRIYLYRSFRTEALKILLPNELLETETSAEMFKAGLERALKVYYKASPDHIHMDVYHERRKNSSVDDTYLVMYDVVPGGTGYLAKLFDTEEFSKLLTSAYEQIHSCTCQFTEKDGCYKCILNYGNRYSRDQFSRKIADELFEKLSGNKHRWEAVCGSLPGNLPVDPITVLEQKFETSLKSFCDKEKWALKKVPEGDSHHFDLRIKGIEDGSEIHYLVRPQYVLTHAHGIAYHTIPDYQFICTGMTVYGKEVKTDDVPQWSVYLDGYSFHAKTPNMNFPGDLKKRDGIRAGVKYMMFPWTLTHKDLENYDKESGDGLGADNFSRFMEMLRSATLSSVTETAFGYIEACVAFSVLNGMFFSLNAEADGTVYERLRDDSSCDEVLRAFKSALTYKWHVPELPSDTDLDEEEWNAFWRRYNLVQFFTEGEEEKVADCDAVAIDRDEIKIYYPGYEALVDTLIDNGISFSHEGDADLCDADGTVIASAGVLLRDYMLAVDPMKEEDRKVFEAAGYAVISLNEFDVTKLKRKV